MSIDIQTLKEQAVSEFEYGADYIKDMISKFPESSKRILISDDDSAPRWNSHSFKWEWLTDEIEDARKWLDKVNKMLESAKNVLNNARAVISFIKQWLSFWEDTLMAFLKMITDYADRIIRDTKSTGLYFLDMTTYHFFDPDHPELEDTWLRGAWWEPYKLTEKEIKDKAKKIQKKLNKETTLQGMAQEIKNLYDGNIDMDDVLSEIFHYKKETYKEFIEKICHHFTDPNDFAEPQFKLLKGMNDSRRISVNFDQAQLGKIVDRWKNREVKTVISQWSGGDGNIAKLRTGPPDFGPTGKLHVIIIAVAFPDISQIFNFLWALFGRNKDGNLMDNSGLLGQILGDLSNIVQGAKDIYNAVFQNPFRRIDITGYKQQYPTTQWPYWVGFTANNLFGPIWDFIDEFVGFIRSLSIKVKRTSLDTINQKLSSMIRTIEKYIKLVELIDQILEFIMMLLNIPTFSMLHIESNEGTAGAIRMIKNSTGFFDNQFDDIREVIKAKDHILNQLYKQETLDRHKNTYISPNPNPGASNIEFDKNSQNGTDMTIHFIESQHQLWKNRYNVVKNIHGYIINYSLKSGLEQYFENKDQLEEIEEQIEDLEELKQDLIDSGATPEEIAEVQEDIDNAILQKESIESEILSFETVWEDKFGLIQIEVDSLPDIPEEDQTAYYQNPNDPNYVDYKEIVKFNSLISGLVISGKQAINANNYEDAEETLDTMMGILYKQRIMIYKTDEELKIYGSDSVEKLENIAFEQQDQPLRFYLRAMESKVQQSQEFIEQQLHKFESLIDSRLKRSKIYDPDKKMMFAGLVFAFGYPNYKDSSDDFESTFDNFTLAAQSEKEDLHKHFKDKKLSDLQNSWKKFKKFF